ncbi:hypothetical protein [Pseudomonas bohemica]|uniref:hypothetical protein n=1 Tax=Pseudomonas bohemica TaxID=2044872 RepID=UPI0018FEEFF3|nr:hypothetical protein [Pseudomonas bohemica]
MQGAEEMILKCLDSMALALAGHSHQWTPELRQAYEASVSYLTSGGYKETDSSVSD